ncbi:MAG: hypothetical protein IGS03_18860 [Candidatus Sericytochromatia bacterium]|nr:hypothetical protein [Candidatus Sericytochromatia bacterium]
MRDVHSDEEPEAKPYLELSDELPEAWRFQQGGQPTASPEVTSAEILPPVNPASPLLRGSELQRRHSFVRQLRQVPRWMLISLCLSLVVLLALMPQLLLVVAGVLRVVLLALRALALPVGAVLLALWLIRLFYPRQNR